MKCSKQFPLSLIQGGKRTSYNSGKYGCQKTQESAATQARCVGDFKFGNAPSLKKIGCVLFNLILEKSAARTFKSIALALVGQLKREYHFIYNYGTDGICFVKVYQKMCIKRSYRECFSSILQRLLALQRKRYAYSQWPGRNR